MARVYRRNGKYWIDFNDADGVRHRKKVGPSKRVAEEALNHVLDQVARHEFLGIVEESSVSFADFSKAWSARVLPQVAPRTAERWAGIVKNHLKPFFKGSLKSIDLDDTEKYVSARLEAEASVATTNREVAVLRHILKRACQWKLDGGAGRYLARYPLAGWKPKKEPSGRTRFLSEEEMTRLLIACEESRSSYLKAFVLVALNTGMRRGEILGLTRRSIDWQNQTVKLVKTKNGEARHVHLNKTALEALRSVPTRIDGRLFPFKDGNSVSRAFRRAVERAGIEDFRLHDNRHTFASYQAMARTPQRALQGLLGHKDGRMTARYTHLSDTYLKDAVNAVNLGAPMATPLPKAASDSE
jgi:integrase